MTRALFTATLLVSFCGMSAYAEQAAPRIGVLSDGISDFWTSMRDQMLEASQEAGVALDFRMPTPATIEQQQELARLMVESGVAALAVAPVNPEKQSAWLDQLAAQTAVVTLLKDAPESKRIVHLGRDEYEVGRALGRFVMASVPEGLKVAAFCSTPDAPQVAARIAGLKEVLDDSLTILDAVLPDHGDRMLAWANLDDLLRQRPEIACIIGLNDYYGPLMSRAVREAGRARWVRVVAVGATPRLQDDLANGVVHGLVGDSVEGFSRITLESLHALAVGAGDDIIPDDGVIVGPIEEFAPISAPTAEEMLDELELQVPWISEVTPGAP